MTTDEDHNWKTKMGVEFSGLEGTRDFFIAFAFVFAVILVGMVVAFVMFG